MSRIATQRHADEQPEPLALRLQEGLNGDVVGNVVRAGAWRPRAGQSRHQADRPAADDEAIGVSGGHPLATCVFNTCCTLTEIVYWRPQSWREDEL